VIWATDEVCRGGNERALAIQRHALRQLDGLWVLSRPQAELVRQWLGPGAPPVSFLPFGVDETFYAATPYPERPCIVSIGGDRDRDAQSLFRVLATVVRARPDVRCVVQTSSVLAPPPGVRTLASVPHDQVRQLYAEASAVLIATRPNWHGSGMTVALEAMSSGRPVVASDTPGLADYVRPGATGELVTPGDAAGQAERVLSLLQDRDRAAAMGAAGRRVVETDHTAGGMCEKLRTLIGL
jgi:glycosyltransferase involved in cell wall biosynthesis